MIYLHRYRGSACLTQGRLMAVRVLTFQHNSLKTKIDQKQQRLPVKSSGKPECRIRNVGLIAHIDAGKTTTTERMLYCAGRTRIVGEVDRGDTVTDYLTEERERGISIMSAAACLRWRGHDVHLIDTPGHVDFTFEVERSLAAVDSAVVILDACRGVETQTRTVWSQADKYRLPRVIFLNKMDRSTADIAASLGSLRNRFAVKGGPTFFLLQSPVFTNVSNGSRRLMGIIDLPSLTLKTWPEGDSDEMRFKTIKLFDVLSGNINGIDATSMSLSASPIEVIAKQAVQARGRLLSSLAELDDTFAEEYILLDQPECLVTVEDAQDCIRRIMSSNRGFPVLLGSSRQKIGVQPLLDAFVDYLPDPTQRPAPAPIAHLLSRMTVASSSETTHPPLLLLAFKILFDSQRGPLTLSRIFSGHLRTGMQVTNWTRQDDSTVDPTEKILGLCQLTGDSYETLESAGPGAIVAIMGLQTTRTGDLLCDRNTTNNTILPPVSSDEEDILEEDEISSFVAPPLHAVVHAALEPRSSASFRNLEAALLRMHREDPSFSANFNAETGQWVVGGMGDLHLEVSIARLRREYKLDVAMGSLLTTFKEMPMEVFDGRNKSTEVVSTSTGLVGGRQRTLLVHLILQPDSIHNKPQIHFNQGWSLQMNTAHPSAMKKVMACIRQGCDIALATGGPLLRSPISGCILHICRIGQQTECDGSDLMSLHVPQQSAPFTAFSALLRSAIVKAVRQSIMDLEAEWRLMEPVMSIEIQIPLEQTSSKDTSVAPFIGEIIRRGGEIDAIEVTEGLTGERCSLRAFAPLAELTGLSATVRSLSSGLADISLQLADYRAVNTIRQQTLLAARSSLFSGRPV